MTDLSASDQKLIDRIKEKAAHEFIKLRELGYPARLFPPAPPEEIEWAEEIIGWKLPPLIREIYLQVGNGGFGPGYGITGLRTGEQIYDMDFSVNAYLVRDYLADIQDELNHMSRRDKSNPKHTQTLKKTASHLSQMENAIMYGYWGCNVTTWVDCSRSDYPVYALDSGHMEVHSSKTLSQWWEDWLDGSIEQY